MSDTRLFDPRTTIPPRCAYCQTDQPHACLWAKHRTDGGELEGKTKPRTCLQRHDPNTAQLPEGF